MDISIQKIILWMMIGEFKNMRDVISEKEAMEIARSYNILSSQKQLVDTLESLSLTIDFSKNSKYEIHSIYNELILNNYSSEQLMKSLLVDYFIDENVVSAFEIKANNSRLDFLRINGHSISYEIKSQVDNLKKLSKQTLSYSELFEYNNVVVGENHLKKVRHLIPSGYGIFVEVKGVLLEKRKAKKNKNISAEMQLNLFTKKEINFFFNMDATEVMKEFSSKDINTTFKQMLKKRYKKRWEFLKKHKNDILPVDYQYFYQHNISPSLIYNKG